MGLEYLPGVEARLWAFSDLLSTWDSSDVLGRAGAKSAYRPFRRTASHLETTVSSACPQFPWRSGLLVRTLLTSGIQVSGPCLDLAIT